MRSHEAPRRGLNRATGSGRAAPARVVRKPRTREVTGPRSGGITTALRGASLDWDWRVCLVPGNAAPGTEIAASKPAMPPT